MGATQGLQGVQATLQLSTATKLMEYLFVTAPIQTSRKRGHTISVAVVQHI